MKSPAVSYKRHRFPQQIISHAVWLYYRFPLSLRLVEEIRWSAELSSRMKRSVDGVGNSDRPTLKSFVAGDLRARMSGIWMRW